MLASGGTTPLEPPAMLASGGTTPLEPPAIADPAPGGPPDTAWYAAATSGRSCVTSRIRPDSSGAAARASWASQASSVAVIDSRAAPRRWPLAPADLSSAVRWRSTRS